MKTNSFRKINIKKVGIAIVIFLTSLAFAYFLFLVYLFYSPYISEYFHRSKFDSSIWKNETLVHNIDNPVRLRMIDDLLEKHSLVGMSKDQVNELLGVPQPTGYFSEYEYVYWLGPERGFVSIDSEWLGIKFSNDIVTEATVLRD